MLDAGLDQVSRMVKHVAIEILMDMEDDREPEI